MRARLPVSLVVPTVGRTAMLRECLQSVAAGTALPAEVVLVDQSSGDALAALGQAPPLPIRRIASQERNVAAAYNVGIRAATEAIVAVTHDDCTVAADW